MFYSRLLKNGRLYKCPSMFYFYQLSFFIVLAFLYKVLEIMLHVLGKVIKQIERRIANVEDGL